VPYVVRTVAATLGLLRLPNPFGPRKAERRVH